MKRTMKKREIRHGFAIPMVILTVVALAGFVVTVNTMNSGLKTQIVQSNHDQLSFLVAYSAFSHVLAKIHANSWSKRPFAGGPYTEMGVSVPGGAYDLNVVDTPGKDFQADIYIRTRLGPLTRVYIWRIHFNDDLLDVSNRIYVGFFRVIDPANFPQGTGSPYAAKIDELLAARASKQKKSEDLAMMIGQMSDPQNILSLLNGGNIAPFSKQYQIPAEGSQEPVPFPVMAPPGSPELPSAAGPGPTAPANPNFPSPPPADTAGLENLNKLGAQIASVSRLAVTSYENAITALRPGNEAEINAHLASGTLAIESTTENLGKLLADAKTQMNSAPSAAAAQAIKDMVANTSISAIDALQQTFEVINNGMFDDGTYAKSLPTSGHLAGLLNDWENCHKKMVDRDQSMRTVAKELEGYSLDDAKKGKIASILTASTDAMDFVQRQIDMVKVLLDKKKKEEADAALAASNPTQTETSTETAATTSTQTTTAPETPTPTPTQTATAP